MASDPYAGQRRGGADAYASYFAGMDRTMRQKVALTTAHLPARGAVADMGSGSGRGTYDLACLHPGLDLAGVDIAPEAVASASAAFRRHNLRYLVGDIADPVFPPGSLDGILDSSVLHHVTSFNGFSTRRLEECLDHQVASLRPGGVLVIRDFVVPEGPAEVELRMRSDDGQSHGAAAVLSTAALWRRYAATVANSRWRPGQLAWRALPDPEPGWAAVACGLRDAHDFILRKDYRADWAVELLEEYAYWSRGEFVAALERRGLRVVVAAEIRNPWIIANRWQGRIGLRAPGGAALPWPPTNLVVVGEKLPPGRGARLVLRDSAPEPAPRFLRLTGWRGPDGRVMDLAERPGRTLDVVPWFVRDGQVLVLAKQGFPRPVTVAAPSRPDLAGAHWSGWLTEPVSAITDPAEGLEAAARRICAERAGIAGVRAIAPSVRYAPSPGGLDEVVTAVLAEVEPATTAEPRYGDLAEAGTVRELDAAAVLRANQVGGTSDARLEVNVHRLLRRLGRSAGPWIGDTVALADQGAGWDDDPAAIVPDEAVRYVPAPPTGWLDIRRVAVDEMAPDGRVLASVAREIVVPREASSNTAVCLPLLRAGGRVLAGVERRHLPAAQIHAGASGLAVAPAYRLPPGIGHIGEVPGFLAARLAEAGVAVRAAWELGGAWLASPGVTPELVHPFAVEVDAARGPGTLRWILLADLAEAAADGRILDLHLAVLALRAAHALAGRGEP